MRRPLVLALAGVAGLATAVVPALAAEDHPVRVFDNGYDPPSLTIAVGDAVTWDYPEGESAHNVRFTDGYQQPAMPSPPGALWPVRRTFDAAGTYTYVCAAHPSMTGRVVVGDGGTTTGTTTTQTQTTPTQTQTQPPPPPPTETQTSPTVPAPPPATATVRRARSRFCTRRSRRCRRPGVVLLVEADGPLTLEGRLTRRAGSGRFRSFGTLRFEVDTDTERVTFTQTRAGRRLSRGRYRLRIGGGRIAFRVVR